MFDVLTTVVPLRVYEVAVGRTVALLFELLTCFLACLWPRADGALTPPATALLPPPLLLLTKDYWPAPFLPIAAAWFRDI